MNAASFVTEQIPAITRMSRKYASMTLEADADDLAQEMALTLLERAAADPEFANQKPAYIRQAMHLEALRGLDDRRVYNRHIVAGAALEAEDGDDDWTDLVAGDELDPETAAEHAEQAALIVEVIRSLTGREAELMTLIMQGLGTTEIAAKWGTSKAAVSQYKARIAARVRLAL